MITVVSNFDPIIHSLKFIFLSSSIWPGHTFLSFSFIQAHFCSITWQIMNVLISADVEFYSKIELCSF